MIQSIRTFLTARLLEVLNASGQPVFSDGDQGNIFFGPMPRGFLKDNKFAACCFTLQDKKKKHGGLVANTLNEDKTHYTRIRKVYERTVLCRIVLYAAEFKEHWGEDDFKGFIDQLEIKIAGHRVIADAMNNAVRILLHDSIRPWDVEESKQRIKGRSHKAIARVEFIGGVYVTKQTPVIRDVDIQPEYE